MKAVIPAAGLGTRLLPATKSMPKEMLPVVDKPVIQYVVEEAVASGIDDILIVTGRHKRAIEDHFDESFELEARLNEAGRHDTLDMLRKVHDMATIHYVRQAEPRGLGHAVLCAEKFVGNEPFAVLLGDDIVRDTVPATRRLIDVCDTTGTSSLSVMEVPTEHASRYGMIDGEPIPDEPDVQRVRRIVEKPAPEDSPSPWAAMGRYVLTPAIFRHLHAIPPGYGGEIQLTDALDRLAQEEGLHACAFRGQRLDTGNTLGLIEANIRLAMERDDLRPALQALWEGLADAPVLERRT